MAGDLAGEWGAGVSPISTNAGATVNVLEAVRKINSVKIMANVTSDKCYEDRGWVWGCRENCPLGWLSLPASWLK